MMMKHINNRRGQFLIETVLMMVVTVGLFAFGTAKLREEKFMAKLISGPWEKVAGMIETGVWDTSANAASKHPNTLNRGISYDPR